MIVLKNINGKETVRTIFRGKKVVIKPKCSYICEDNEEGRKKADYLLSTFGFLVNITNLIQERSTNEDKNSIQRLK